MKICLLIIFTLLALSLRGWAQEEQNLLPDDPMRGARLFAEKGCVLCHGMGEEDGKIGPDLGRIHLKGSILDVAGLMWNHSIMMEEKMKELQILRPTFTDQEMSDLIAFLTAYQYYLRELGRPGDPEAGKIVFEKNHCSNCHSFQEDWSKIGPSLATYRNYSSIQIAQVMWNHGKAMKEEFERSKIKLPKFRGNEMADLLAYLQKQPIAEEFEPAYVEPGSPIQGKTLFKEKGCISCHTVQGKGGKKGPDLGKRREELVRSIPEVAGLLWNHGPRMWKKMGKENIPFPEFKGKEMSDLIAYLYFVNYFDQPGDKNRGRKIFMEKNCVKCHQSGGIGKKFGPDLSKSESIRSPVAITTAMWNHAPYMSRWMKIKGIPWPKFKTGEMADLIEFLLTQKEKT